MDSNLPTSNIVLEDVMNNSEPIVSYLVTHSSNKLRNFFGLKKEELIQEPIPRVVTRKDPSLDNYFADLLLRTCYPPTNYTPDFEEVVIRGDNVELPTNLNPQIAGAVLIGIGGQSKNKDFIRSYDEHHADDGTRIADSASQVVFFRHLNEYRRSHDGIHRILPILNALNDVDSQGNAGENHLIQMTKNLHYAQFQSLGYVVEGFSFQLKRAVIDAILSSLCLTVTELRDIDMKEAGKELREAWKIYRGRRDIAVKAERLPPVSMDTFGKVVNRTTSDNPDNLQKEQKHPFSLRRMLYALNKVWGKETALFVTGFIMESLLQLQEEYEEGMKMPLDETSIPKTDYSLFYHVMPATDKRPHRAIISRVNKEQKKAIVVLKDSHRQIMSIFKSKGFEEDNWIKLINWLKEKEPHRWYCPFNEDTNKYAVFIVNGTRSYLGSESSELTKQDLTDGLKAILH